MGKNQDKLKNVQTSKQIVDIVKTVTDKSEDMVYREIEVFHQQIYVVFNEALSSSDAISNFVIRSIKQVFQSKHTAKSLSNIQEQINDMDVTMQDEKLKLSKRKKLIESIQVKSEKDEKIAELISVLEKNISISKVKKLDLQSDDLFYYLYSGFACIIYDAQVLAVEVKANLDRAIAESTTESTIKGPKDAFTENFQKNIGLIRRKIKDENLILEQEMVGRRSKTQVGIMYIKDIVREELVKEVKKKLKKIDIDAILDSNYIAELISESNKTNFPITISTERPDRTSFYLLEGRVALIIENSPYVIIIPAFLNDFINNIEDYYQKNLNVIFTRIIRYLALFITIFTPALYVALITFNQEAIPTELLISFTSQREGVPFPAVVEAFLMIVSFEILRECDYRTPNIAGNTLSIVGALILGDAAVSAGIVSPIMIIVIAITTISGLMFSDINMGNSLRTWRVIFLVFASMGGLIGLSVATLLLITKLCSITSFSKPYTYPLAPVNVSHINNLMIKRKEIPKETKRMLILTDNLTKEKASEESDT